MSAMNKKLAIAIGSYVLALIAYWLVSPYIAIAIPAAGLFGALLWGSRSGRAIAEQPRGPELQQRPQEQTLPQQIPAAPNGAAAAPQAETPKGQPMDPELASALEYIGVIEDMILLEGEQNNLDDEIVQKSLALLTRLNRLIPDLAALGDSSINHNILRLVRKDLNSTINPFLRLSGEAKRQNRRLLLDGIKDIDSKLTFYTKTIEQKDLMELRTKAELIQQRYRLND